MFPSYHCHRRLRKTDVTEWTLRRGIWKGSYMGGCLYVSVCVCVCQIHHMIETQRKSTHTHMSTLSASKTFEQKPLNLIMSALSCFINCIIHCSKSHYGCSSQPFFMGIKPTSELNVGVVWAAVLPRRTTGLFQVWSRSFFESEGALCTSRRVINQNYRFWRASCRRVG